MMAFNKYSAYDPVLQLRQIERELGRKIFTPYALLDPVIMQRQLEAALGRKIFGPLSQSSDPVLLQWLIKHALDSDGGYRAKAVHFDGTVTIGTVNGKGNPFESALADDSPLGLASIWVKDPVSAVIGLNLNEEFLAAVNYSGVGALFLASNQEHTDEAVAGSALVPSGWFCVMMAWNANFASGSRVLQIALGDELQAIDVFADIGNAFAIPYSMSDQWYFGGFATGGASWGDEADLQLWCGVTADLTDVNVRRKFIDANGKPVDPAIAAAAFGPQTVLLSGDHNTFAINQGSGPTTGVITGTITDAGTSPSN
jgi:hypothetical protein